MMNTRLDLELDLLPGPAGSGLTLADREAIRAFVDSPTLENWVAAGNVAIARDGVHDASLASKVVYTYRCYREGQTYFTIHQDMRTSMWHRAPDPEHIVALIKQMARTDHMPSIDLELSLARSNDNKLSADERRALSLLYYRPTVEHLMAAKDIVLLEGGNADGGDLTFILALDLVSPEWLANNLGEERRGSRRLKVFKAAPVSALTYAALVRATH